MVLCKTVFFSFGLIQIYFFILSTSLLLASRDSRRNASLFLFQILVRAREKTHRIRVESTFPESSAVYESCIIAEFFLLYGSRLGRKKREKIRGKIEIMTKFKKRRTPRRLDSRLSQHYTRKKLLSGQRFRDSFKHHIYVYIYI